jgi:hypothetical protein
MNIGKTEKLLMIDTLETSTSTLAIGTSFDRSHEANGSQTIDLVHHDSFVADSTNRLEFPSHCITGSLGKLAMELSEGTEITPEFIFVASMTFLGSLVSGDLAVDVGLESLTDTRLYSILLGKSYSAKKSSALARVQSFFQTMTSVYNDKHHVVHGVGSAEGLARVLSENQRVLLSYDEFRTFFEKASVQSSTLLQMTASLFEQRQWDNAVKDHSQSFAVKDARLGIIGCSTLDTYENMWTRESLSTGLPNRFFVVIGGEREPISFPRMPNSVALDSIRQRIQQQIARLPVKFSIAPNALALWDAWYKKSRRRNSVHTARLDTIGFRLMAILALTMDKKEVDAEVMQVVIDLLEYEFWVRLETDPIDADTTIAKLEQKIKRVLAEKPLTPRDLRRRVNADRTGIWPFKRALENLRDSGQVGIDQSGRYYVLSDDNPRVVDSVVSTVDSSKPPVFVELSEKKIT